MRLFSTSTVAQSPIWTNTVLPTAPYSPIRTYKCNIHACMHLPKTEAERSRNTSSSSSSSSSGTQGGGGSHCGPRRLRAPPYPQSLSTRPFIRLYVPLLLNSLHAGRFFQATVKLGRSMAQSTLTCRVDLLVVHQRSWDPCGRLAAYWTVWVARSSSGCCVSSTALCPHDLAVCM